MSEAETCPICDRVLIEGPSIDEHHMVPRSKKGREKVLMHRICHQKIHSLFTENELAHFYHTIERLRDHDEIAKYVKWVQTKDPEYYDSHRETNQKRSRRR